ncbi:MAG: hypothetical protein JO343_10590 [Candidatus Eremiobacteraeota bacterium]|nr:hypothetical protein [Candidatus Eremiobacteraeota bacterium]
MDTQIPFQLQQPAAAARRLLRLYRCRPHELERDALALRLRATLKTATCRDAIVRLIERTFAGVPDDRCWRETIVRCDVRREKARAAASAMHLSLRQFYRRRSEAFEALAAALEPLDAPPPAGESSQVLCARCRRELFGNDDDAATLVQPHRPDDPYELRPSC